MTSKKAIQHRFMVAQLEEYKSGNLSLGALAEVLELSMLETLNLVASFHAHPHMPKDYLVEASAEAGRILG